MVVFAYPNDKSCILILIVDIDKHISYNMDSGERSEGNL